MKVKYIYLGIVVATLLGACSRDEESLFDQSAAERAVAALENANKVLTAPENGWEMLYFANPESRGYNIIVKFDANGRVTATAKNSATTGNKIMTDESTWEVKNDYGPILTFETYNEVLHAWADPRSDGDGLLGDYEFLILHATADNIKLKGKKHGAYCYLYPITESIAPEAYFAEVEAVNKRLFANNNLLTWVSGDKTYLLSGGQTGIFSLIEPGELLNSEDLEIYPFAVNRSGVQLTFPIRDNEDVCYSMGAELLTAANSSIGAGELSNYFFNYMNIVACGWAIDIKELCPTIQTLFSTADEQIKTTYNNKKKGGITEMKFYSAQDDSFVLNFSYIGSGTKASTYYYLYKMQRSNDRVKIAYSGPNDENSQKVLAALPAIEPLLKGLEGDFKLSGNDALNPTLGLLLTDNSNPALWVKFTGSGK